MSILVDDVAGRLSCRLRAERQRRQWSLADLAAHSGVSKAMLSKIEREQVSPTATILVRIAAALDLTLAGLLEPYAARPEKMLRAADQPRWRDPGTGYIRCQVYQSADQPLELVEVSLPPGACVGFPASSYMFIRQVVWLLSGELEISEGNVPYVLQPGDRFEFGPPADSAFRNIGDRDCRYLVALVRQ
jgi:transcriptional regulator with XRE-family HTH domain